MVVRLQPFMALGLLMTVWVSSGCGDGGGGGSRASATRRLPSVLFTRGHCDARAGIDLYSIAADGSHLRRLTDNGASWGYANWSPSGRRVVFTAQLRGKCSEENRRPLDVFEMNPDGSHVRRVTHDGDAYEASLSRKGGRLVYVRGGSSSIIVANTAARDRRAIGKGDNPQWSPDGRRILYNSASGSRLLVYDLATRRTQHVAGFPNDFFLNAAWSPDGTRIAFPRDIRRSGHDNYELWLMRSDGSGKTQVTREKTGMDDDRPTWSPDGKSIVFIRHLQHADLVLLTLDGRHEKVLVHGANELDSPTWSPDGTMIAFERSANEHSHLWVIRPDGSGLRQLTSDPPDDNSPAFQP